ncbi:unnamed protein product [[Actinomadura] parvosata subsp. kistnae]|uniref:Uncharacterized protein n=1 Tax=[Actinomadura] parvosata subsp. kistnae TaxID=1909395 RepID=A0A1U9ZVV4_9ACTN|nr:hypothetical protein BKM31_11820 [Nonomuraea sp. ATCC 55076]SPL89410.1 unnamed protein product [Actinomadura parvosata subsp. kistnae]
MPADRPVEASAEARALRVPLDDFTLSRLDIHTIEYAEDLLTRACMRGRGFDWELLPPPARTDTDPLHRRRYGVIEPEVAERYGYHVPPPAPDQQAREQVWRRREALPPAEQRAAYGPDGQGGCRETARTRLAQGIPAVDQQQLNGYIGDTFEASQRVPAVVAAFGAWSACMKAGGFTYRTPLDAANDRAWASSARPAPREIAVAVADVVCKRATGLVATWSAADQAVQLAAIAAHRTDFARFRQARDAELRAARQVIGQTGPPSKSTT